MNSARNCWSTGATAISTWWKVCAAAASGEYGVKEITIRANGLDTEWHADDITAIAQAGEHRPLEVRTVVRQGDASR